MGSEPAIVRSQSSAVVRSTVVAHRRSQWAIRGAPRASGGRWALAHIASQSRVVRPAPA